MIDNERLDQLRQIYEGHGWQLRRIVVEGDAAAAQAAGVPVRQSCINALWFSRPLTPGLAVPWELRYAGDPAFALVAHLDSDQSDLDAHLSEVEMSMRDKIVAKRLA